MTWELRHLLSIKLIIIGLMSYVSVKEMSIFCLSEAIALKMSWKIFSAPMLT